MYAATSVYALRIVHFKIVWNKMLERIERQKKAVFSLSLLVRTKLIHFSSHWKCCMEMETCEEKLHLFALESETFNCTFLFVYSILAQKRRV